MACMRSREVKLKLKYSVVCMTVASTLATDGNVTTLAPRASRTTKGVKPHMATVHINAFIVNISASMHSSRTTK